jgi:diguanylate cyclase (GGDEF)-like protein/PAS domain S-box-containing protein
VGERPRATGAGPRPHRPLSDGTAGSHPHPGASFSHDLLDMAPGVVCLLNAQGLCVAANSGAVEAFGRPPGGLVGRPLHELLPSHYSDVYPALLNHSACSGRAAATCTDAEGGRRRMTMWSLGETGAAGEQFVLVVDDVTQQELAEQALRDSESKASALLNAPSDSVFMIGRDDTLLAINRAAAERLGKQSEGLIGRRAAEVLSAELTPDKRSLIREVFRTGLPVRFEDERDDSAFDNLLYPIVGDDGSVGACAVYARDVTQRRRAEERARRRTLELSSLLETSRALASSTLDYDRVVEVATHMAAKALDVPQCSLWEFDPEEQQLLFRHLFQRTPDPDLAVRMEGACLPTSDYLGETDDFRSGRPVQCVLGDDGLPASLEVHMRLYGRRSWLMVPLSLKDDVLGALVLVETDKERRFTQEETALAQGIAEQVTAAMANARLHRMMEQQAITDGLTGLCNHRHFYTRLEEEVARAKRYHHGVAVLMIDLDDFKELNDVCGHLAGDEVVQAVASALAGSTRWGADLVARYGGEEFAVMLPNTQAGSAVGIEGALTTAERMRRAVAEVPLPVPDVRLTASVGVAVFPDTAADLGELVNQADEALYKAKSDGKDRVVVYSAG